MSTTVYRAYDSLGSVKVTESAHIADRYREMGYPVEVWAVDGRGAVSRARSRLKWNLGGGRGPGHLSGLPARRIGEYDEVIGDE